MAYVLAAVGGALGALARSGVATALPPSPGGWPWATLLVNLTGCLLIGVLLAVLHSRFPASTWWRPFLAVGVLGGYTTFSTLMYETMRLVEDGDLLRAGANSLGSIVAGLMAVYLGIVLGRLV